MRLFRCSAGWEAALIAELRQVGRVAETPSSGVVVERGPTAGEAPAGELDDPVFARQVLPGAAWVEGESIRALAETSFAAVESTVDAHPGPFTLHVFTGADPSPGLGSRAGLVGQALLNLLRDRRRRAARRWQQPDAAAATFGPGWLLVQLLALDRDRLAVSAATPRPLARGGLDLAPWPAGEAPVATDRDPPSRAYQKLEEALAWMGAAPRPGERCVDLGASPGGWTATALKRDARVLAIDRAPLAASVARDPRVTSTVGNAFTFLPAGPVDWLLCDVVCAPGRSLEICETWLARGLCRNLVVTVKFKGRDGYGVLGALPKLFDRIRPAFARVKQLAHNKNEVTVMVRA